MAIDMAVGLIFPMLVSNAKGGDNKRNNYICNDTKEDILVFGSSRAIHHYNPEMISDSTGMTCYNCGQDGNGIILNHARLKIITERYAPKYIIYDVTPGFDLLAGDDNHKYLGMLRAYYDRNGIPGIFESVDQTEKYKMQSRMYRYNSRFVQMISDCIMPMQSLGIKGFRPLTGQLDETKIDTKTRKKALHPVFDSLKLEYFDKLIALAPRTKFIFVVSPIWYGMDERSLQPIKDLCEKHNVPFYDFSNDSKYVHNNIYFKDGVHLNAYGADEFTRDLMTRIKSDRNSRRVRINN